jgi:hypothetical protein
MKFIFRIGWADSVVETDWTTLQDVARAYALVFDAEEHNTLRKMQDQIDNVNGEGNYHEFVFQVLDVRGA